MTTRLVASMNGLIRSMKAARGVSLTYTRGAYSVTLTGWLGNTGVSFLSKIQAEPSASNETSNADFMIVASELILNSAAISPRIGDTITMNCNGSTLSYVVMPTNQGDPAWKNVFEQKGGTTVPIVYRIHATAAPGLTVTYYSKTDEGVFTTSTVTKAQRFPITQEDVETSPIAVNNNGASFLLLVSNLGSTTPKGGDRINDGTKLWIVEYVDQKEWFTNGLIRCVCYEAVS